MNQEWQRFLLSEQALFENDERAIFSVESSDFSKYIYPLVHFGVLSVTGQDAAVLLQGQLTCNIHELTSQKAKLAGMCNPKGRVISTFLVIKKDEGFLLVLPKSLVTVVKNKLQLYVLRSKVLITDCSDVLCVMGSLTQDTAQAQQFDCHNQDNTLFLAMSAVQNRQLIIAESNSAMALWSHAVGQQGFQPTRSDAWRTLDILSGIPWLDVDTSEEYIPQMLNLDKLGGISFNKGCYTGQEVVARTHYLGKAKRALFIAEANLCLAPSANAPVFDDNIDNTQAVGNVLMAQENSNGCTLLLVLNIIEDQTLKLTLADQTPLTLRI